LACTESQATGFEDFSSKSNGVYYGHLSPTSNTGYCASLLEVYGDASYLASK
jgi:formylmethanofuran:tetrahydromethanopterin formyltransferase